MKVKILLAALCALALHLEARAGDATVPAQPKSLAPSDVPAAVEFGQIYRIAEGGKMEYVDMSRFQVLAIEWRGAAFGADFELGLRSDGVIVWRRAAR